MNFKFNVLPKVLGALGYVLLVSLVVGGKKNIGAPHYDDTIMMWSNMEMM